MITTNVTNFRNNVFDLLEQAVKYSEPISVSTKSGNAIVISEEDYNGIIETLYLSSIPSVKQAIVEGLSDDIEECVPEELVVW